VFGDLVRSDGGPLLVGGVVAGAGGLSCAAAAALINRMPDEGAVSVALSPILAAAVALLALNSAAKMTLAEAEDGVERHAARALSALQPGASLEERSEMDAVGCDFGMFGKGPPKGVRATKDYAIAGLDSRRVPEHFQLVRAWWASHGYTTRVPDEERGDGRYHLVVEHTDIPFVLALHARVDGDMHLEVSSPCIDRPKRDR
jgi:hypothetical protein